MSKEALVNAVKQIMAQTRSGDVEGAYDGYAALYATPEFVANKPEDQRQALKLLILAKRHGQPSDKLIAAHRAAIPALTELVSTLNEPEDYEMLGICHLLIGNEQAASNMFRQGLTLERAKNPASDLCGRLMTRVAAI
jgi:ribosomal protein L9